MKKSIKQIYESIILDSRIDFPREALCENIWDKRGDKYILKMAVKEVILDAAGMIQKPPIFNIINDIRIVGSICSNQYTLTSDIDVHFTLTKQLKQQSSDELNKKLRDFIKSNKNLKELCIDTHPVEFYFQYNEYQDLMSAGVYNIKDDEWITGPTIVELTFNPYEEYKEAFSVIGEYIKRIEECVSDIKHVLYEDDKNIKKIISLITPLINIKTELKEYRRSFSSPTNAEEAEKFKADKEWHKIDAVFKFIDKFGYLRKITLVEKILKEFNEYKNVDLVKQLKEIL
jgi:hypothetical protein